ncbi:radical SAM protein [archaeon]|nr:radical SAM protein [archaeon]
MKNGVKLVKSMYHCQNVPVVVFEHRCPNPCLYCDLYQRDFLDEEIIAAGLKNVLKKLGDFKGAYFSAVTDIFLKKNAEIAHYLIKNIWEIKKDFVPLIVTKNVIPEKTIKLLIKNKHKVVVQISIPSLNDKLISILEPGSASVLGRLETMKKLTSAGVPVTAVVMPWFDVYEEDENIEYLPRALAKAGIVRCIIGTGVLPEEQKQKMINSNNKLVLNAVKNMTESKEVTTKTGHTLPFEKRILAFERLIKAFNKFEIKARICTADNSDLINITQLPLCEQFKHPYFGEKIIKQKKI